jgi:hypothetical protein
MRTSIDFLVCRALAVSMAVFFTDPSALVQLQVLVQARPVCTAEPRHVSTAVQSTQA